MTQMGARCSGKAAWALPMTLLIVSAAFLLLTGSPVDASVPLALDAVLVCLAYRLCVVLAGPTAHAAAAHLVRCPIEAIPPRLRESDAGMPGRAWPRAPGRESR